MGIYVTAMPHHFKKRHKSIYGVPNEICAPMTTMVDAGIHKKSPALITMLRD
jgi:hypothetical protein